MDGHLSAETAPIGPVEALRYQPQGARALSGTTAGRGAKQKPPKVNPGANRSVQMAVGFQLELHYRRDQRTDLIQKTVGVPISIFEVGHPTCEV